MACPRNGTGVLKLYQVGLKTAANSLIPAYRYSIPSYSSTSAVHNKSAAINTARYTPIILETAVQSSLFVLQFVERLRGR